MQDHNQPLEMHIHGDVPCRQGVTTAEIESALAPLIAYTKRHHAAQGGSSLYEEEPGIQFTEPDHVLHFCWSVAGDVDFRETLDELVMGLNDISREGATLEVSFYDLEFDEEDCSDGLKAIRSYRKDWDEERGVWKDKPRHDWASHGADAFRTFATQYKITPQIAPAPKKPDC